MISQDKAVLLEWWQVRASQLKWTHYFQASGSISSSLVVSVLSLVVLESVFPDCNCKSYVCQSRKATRSSQQELPKTQKNQLMMRDECKL